MPSQWMNRPAPISVFADQPRTKSTTRSRTSCGTHTLARAPQDFFLKRCARPSAQPSPRPWSGSSSRETRSVAVRLDGPDGHCSGRRQRRSQRTLFANGRTPLAAAPVPHTTPTPAPYPTSAVVGWQPSLLRCNAFAVFPCVLSAILTEERPLQFQLRQDRQRFHAAAVARTGGERSWIWAAVSLSMTTIGPPHWGQSQRGLDSLAVDASC